MKRVGVVSVLALFGTVLFQALAPAAFAKSPKPAALAALHVCKTSANGTSGHFFSFSVNGGTPVLIAGGTCKLFRGRAGAVEVIEGFDPGFQTSGITSGHLISKDVANQEAMVNVVVTGTTVKFTNTARLAADSDLALMNVPANITTAATSNSGANVSWTGPTATDEETPPSVSCFPASGSLFPIGTTTVNCSATDADDSNSPQKASFTVTVTSVPPQFGYIEVCKDYSDRFVDPLGRGFDFTVKDPTGKTTPVTNVVDGQCGPPVQVVANFGDVTVTEVPPFQGTIVTGISVAGGGSVDSYDLGKRVAFVHVLVGDPTTESRVHFVNDTETGQLKVCKTLAPNAASLAGTTFTFFAKDLGPTATGKGTTTRFTIVAELGTQCVLVEGPVDGLWPLGDTIRVREEGLPNVAVTSIVGSPNPVTDVSLNHPPDGDSDANTVIGSGVDVVTFTNEGLGTIEICKNIVQNYSILGENVAYIDYAYQIQNPASKPFVFNYTVNGTIDVNVYAGGCSLPITVPAGTATIVENLAKTPNFHFDHLIVSPADRWVSQSGATVTVNVPIGDASNETLVTYFNEVDYGFVKVCKTAPRDPRQVSGDNPLGYIDFPSSSDPGEPDDAAFFNTPWMFHAKWLEYGAAIGDSGPDNDPIGPAYIQQFPTDPGPCTNYTSQEDTLLGGLLAVDEHIKVIDPQGNPTDVTITEDNPWLMNPNNVSFTYVGKGETDSSGANTITIDIGKGANVVTATNRENDTDLR